MIKTFFNVFKRGEFVFRTEPDNDADRIKQTRDALLRAFPAASDYCVVEYTVEKTTTVIYLDN